MSPSPNLVEKNALRNTGSRKYGVSRYRLVRNTSSSSSSPIIYRVMTLGNKALFRCCDEDKRGEKKGRKGRKRERRRGKGKGKGKEEGEEREREGEKEKGGRGGRGEGGKGADRDIRGFFLLGHNARFLYKSRVIIINQGRHIVAIVRNSPTTSFLPDPAHERATSPLFKASAFAFRSFPLLIRLPSAFAPLGNKRMRHSVRGGRVRSAHGDVRRLTPGIVAWAAELTPGTPLR